MRREYASGRRLILGTGRKGKRRAQSYKTSVVRKALETKKISQKSYKTSGLRNRLCFWDLSQKSPEVSYNTTWHRSPVN